MLVDLVNRYGRHAGNIMIPDDMIEAAQRVASWMMQNNVRELCGLSAFDVQSRTARYPKHLDGD